MLVVEEGSPRYNRQHITPFPRGGSAMFLLPGNWPGTDWRNGLPEGSRGVNIMGLPFAVFARRSPGSCRAPPCRTRNNRGRPPLSSVVATPYTRPIAPRVPKHHLGASNSQQSFLALVNCKHQRMTSAGPGSNRAHLGPSGPLVLSRKPLPWRLASARRMANFSDGVEAAPAMAVTTSDPFRRDCLSNSSMTCRSMRPSPRSYRAPR